MAKEMSNRYVSIIIVTAGRKDYLEACLKSLKSQSHPDSEIIVIDNSVENIFYSGGLNRGIAKSKGDYILCLNDDVVLDSKFIEKALKGFEADEKIGMVSGKILRPDKVTIDSTGLFLTPWRTAKERGYNAKDKGQFDSEGYIFGVSGAAAFYRKVMLDNIKAGNDYFDSKFRMFYEDLDVAWRARNIGWKAYYVPGALAYHARGGTARRPEGIGKRFARRYLSDELYLNLIVNRYRTIIKNESLFKFIFYLPFTLIYDIFIWLVVILSRPILLIKILSGPPIKT